MTARQPPGEKGAKACTIGLYQFRDWYFCAYFSGGNERWGAFIMPANMASTTVSAEAVNFRDLSLHQDIYLIQDTMDWKIQWGHQKCRNQARKAETLAGLVATSNILMQRFLLRLLRNASSRSSKKKTVYYAENQEKIENNRNLQVTRSVAFLLSPTDFCDTMKL